MGSRAGAGGLARLCVNTAWHLKAQRSSPGTELDWAVCPISTAKFSRRLLRASRPAPTVRHRPCFRAAHLMSQSTSSNRTCFGASKSSHTSPRKCPHPKGAIAQPGCLAASWSRPAPPWFGVQLGLLVAAAECGEGRQGLLGSRQAKPWEGGEVELNFDEPHLGYVLTFRKD